MLVLRKRMVRTARKTHVCSCEMHNILPGETYLVGKNGRKWLMWDGERPCSAHSAEPYLAVQKDNR